MRKTQLVMLTAIIALVSCQKKENLTEQSALGKLSLKASGVSLLGSPVGDVVGKLTVGYQGWFLAAGDGSMFNSWQHTNLEAWPDMREYTTSYGNVQFYQGGTLQPAFTGNLGNGQPAKMFSAWDQSTVDVHFSWMKSYNIDCVALQRFPGHFSDPRVFSQVNGVATRVKNAAQTYGRKFYVMYDCSATDPIDADWTNTVTNAGVLNLTASTAYAHQNGKPVVCLYGIGIASRGTAADWLTKINWFKSQGCYVIISAPWGFSTGTYLSAINAANMVLPWAVGRTSTTNFQAQYTTDLTYCNANGLDFQADIFPGFSFNNGNTGKPFNEIPRNHGDFMWQQFAAAKNAGVSNIYVSMFDELNEATQIMKSAEDASMIPAGKQFLTLNVDGTNVSADFYLRLTNDGSRMIKGIIPFAATHPTPHTNYLDRADATTGWGSGNTLSVNTADKKEGTGSLQSVGSATLEFQKSFTAANYGASVATGKIDFWYYVSDVTKFSASNQIEVGSGGTNDVSEYNWNIGTLVNGWNHITKTFATAGTTGGTPNLNAINWFRIYHAKTAGITTKVDAIQILP